MSNGLGNIIKKRRLELNITLDEVGKAVGVSKSTVQRWESGQITNMRRDRIDALSKVLGLSPLIFVDKSTITSAPAQSTPILSNHDKLMIEAYQKAKPKDKYTVDTVLDEYTNGKLIEAATKEQKELEKEHIPEAM